MNAPYSLETEQNLVGSVLRGGRETYETVRDFIQPIHFHDQALQKTWSAIDIVYESGLNIDPVLVGDELEKAGQLSSISYKDKFGRVLLSYLRGEGIPQNAESYAEQVQDYYFKRHLAEFSSKLAVWSMNGRRSKDIIHDVMEEMGKINLFTTQDEYTVSMADAVGDAYDHTDKASKGEIVGVPTGLIDLDRILGSMYSGNVYLVAGRPGKGKTGLLLTIARNAAKIGKRVLIFSLEMGRVPVAQRMIAQETGIDLNRIIRGTLLENEWTKYVEGVATVGELPIVINDLSNININEIRSIARKHVADLIVLDYIQLADAGKKSERRELDVSEVSRGLKYLAREMDVPVLAAAQLSRAVEQRASQRPILSDLRESGSLEQDAYAVMFLYDPDDQQNVKELIVAKHRNGAVGSIDLIWRDTLTKFENAITKKVDFK